MRNKQLNDYPIGSFRTSGFEEERSGKRRLNTTMKTTKKIDRPAGRESEPVYSTVVLCYFCSTLHPGAVLNDIP